jgi:hypothetical protein
MAMTMQQDGQGAMPPLHFMQCGPEHVAMVHHTISCLSLAPPPSPPMYHPPPMSRGNVFHNGFGAQGRGYHNQQFPPTPASALNDG